MTENPYPSPPSANGRYVPMDLYLADREEMKGLLRELTREVRGMRREMDRDDGAEVAEEAATVAVKESRRTRSERFWELGKTLLTAVLGVVATLLTVYVTGGP